MEISSISIIDFWIIVITVYFGVCLLRIPLIRDTRAPFHICLHLFETEVKIGNMTGLKITSSQLY